MAREVTLSKIKVSTIYVEIDGGTYKNKVDYFVENDDGSESFRQYSMKHSINTEEDVDKLSVGSDALVKNFISAITELMEDREDF